MSDLISRADAIEAVRKKLQDWGSYAFEDYRRGLYEAQDIIEALPSADAESHDAINEMNRDIIKDILKMMPTAYLLEALGVDTVDELMKPADAVQGEWKAHRVSLDFICSNCGEACWSDFDYCPHCGARMKRGDEADEG